MFSKEEAFNLRHEFWITLGRYLAPVPSSEGEKINWINYKTGVKDIFFRMKTAPRSASVGIYITHNDLELQQLVYEQFQSVQKILEDTTGRQWNWNLHSLDEHNKIVSSITQEVTGLSVMNKAHWPELITFFKENMIALDQFWSFARYNFDGLI